jgi:hypothetical protein
MQKGVGPCRRGRKASARPSLSLLPEIHCHARYWQVLEDRLLWLAKMAICLQIKQIKVHTTWPASMYHQFHVALAEASVRSGYPISSLSPRAGLGKPGSSATACGLAAEATAAAVCCS